MFNKKRKFCLAEKIKKSSSENWYKLADLIDDYDAKYPLINGSIEGLEILNDVPNTSSISASLVEYEELPGIRAMNFSDFCNPENIFYAVDDFEKSKKLAGQIKNSGEIKPLIIVVDKKGPYILEGAHRFLALHYLGKTTFPALVIIDME